MNNSLIDNNLLGGDILAPLLPNLLEESNTSLDITPSDGAFSDPFSNDTESLSNIEKALKSEQESNNTVPNNFSVPDVGVDPFTGSNIDTPSNSVPISELEGLDLNDTSFAPPKSQLELIGGFGDFEGGNDVTLELKNTDGEVVETFALSGEGQGEVYRDEDNAYLFFSGTDETTNVDISSVSNIKFGDYYGDSLDIETTGSIDGGDVVLSDESGEETGLTLKSGIEGGEILDYEFDGYNLLDFGDVEVVDVNYFGNVVGSLIDDDGQEKAFFYNGAGLFTLNAFYTSKAYGINDRSDIVIQATVSEGDDSQGFIAPNGGAITPLGFTAEGGARAFSFIRDINNSGSVAAYLFSIYPTPATPDTIRAYYLSTTEVADIGTLLDSSDTRAFGINDLGQVVGSNKDTGIGFVYGDGVATSIGTLPGDSGSIAYAINNQGQIVGTSYGQNGSRAFLYSDGVMEDIGVGYAGSVNERSGIDINNSGQVVVGSYLYEEGELTNINDLLNSQTVPEGLNITLAKGINDRGQIIAQGTFEGENHGYLLNPTFQPVYQDDSIDIGNISTYGDSVLLDGGEITLEGEKIQTRGGDIVLNGDSVVNNSLTINSAVYRDDSLGGDITFNGTLDGSNDLTLKAGTGDISFGGEVGGNSPFSNFRINGANTVTANGDITSDELIRIKATDSIIAQNLTSNNGKVKLTSEEKSLTTQDITSGGQEKDNIVLEAVTGITTANLNAAELGRVKISSGKVLEDDTFITGDVVTRSITGKSLDVVSTGSFTATGDIIGHNGKVEIVTQGDIDTQGIASLNKSVNLISAEGGVTVEGDLFSGQKGINIVAANDIITERIESVDGAVGLSSYQGNINIQDDITTTEGGVIIAAKENINFANISTEIGEVSIGSSSGDIVASGNISTGSVGYVNIKTNGSIDLKDVTTNKGYIEIGAGGSITTENLETGSGVINLASALSQININGDITTDGSYVYLEAGLEVATNAIETNGGGVELASFSDFGDVGVLVASAGGEIDLSPDDIEDYQNLSVEKKEVIQEGLIEFAEEVWYKSKPLGEFVTGVIAQWLFIQGEDVRGVLEFVFPTFLNGWSDDTEDFLDQQPSRAFQLGRTAGNLTSIITGILEFAAGTGSQAVGGGLCITGIGCFAGAPAIATGFLLQAHGLGVIKNASGELVEDIVDLLSPNRMESRGGADDIAGLAREIGVSQNRVENAIEILNKDKITRLKERLVYKEPVFGRDEFGNLSQQGERNVNLLKPLLSKLDGLEDGVVKDNIKKLIKNIDKTFDLVGNDIDAIDDIRANLKQNNKTNKQGNLIINDNDLQDAFSDNLEFLKRYGDRVSGAFANRFGRANSEVQDSVQALGEIKTAEDFLDGNTIFDNVSEIRGIQEKFGQKNPEHLAIFSNGDTRLLEVKTLTGRTRERKIKEKLSDAAKQIEGYIQQPRPTKNGYIRLDFSNANPSSKQSSWWLDNVEKGFKISEDSDELISAVDSVEFVEVLYKDARQNDAITKLLIKVENRTFNLVP